jgi:hypothetical protein
MKSNSYFPKKLNSITKRRSINEIDKDNDLYEELVVKSDDFPIELIRFCDDAGIDDDGGPKKVGSRYFKVIRYGDELTHTNYDEVVMKVFPRNKKDGKRSREFVFYLNRHKISRKEMLKILQFRNRYNKSMVIG